MSLAVDERLYNRLGGISERRSHQQHIVNPSPATVPVSCPSCATVLGHGDAPGGIVYANACWLFVLRRQPLLCAGQGFVVLRRHCEHVAQLSAAEQATLGPLLAHISRAFEQTLPPARIHFGLYAEQVRHIHLHVTPRLPHHPAGNIPLTFLQEWYRLLARVGLRRPADDAAVTVLADRLRTVCAGTTEDTQLTPQM